MNLWHDIPAGNADELNVIVEIGKGSHNKYEIDKETGLIKLDRANYSDAAYPFDYGFVPQTLWEDGDPLDVVILSTYPLQSGVMLTVRPVAGIDMVDSGEGDYKVIAVPVSDKRWEDINDLPDLNRHALREFQHFFETYKTLKGKEAKVEIRGIEDKTKAQTAITKAIDLYKNKFSK